MSDGYRNQQAGMMQELDSALNSLDTALAEAGRAVSAVRDQASRFVDLAMVVEEMEATMSRARQNIGAVSTGSAPPLRAVPPREPAPDPYQEPQYGGGQEPQYGGSQEPQSGGGFGSTSYQEPSGEYAPPVAEPTPAQPEFVPPPSQPDYPVPASMAAPTQEPVFTGPVSNCLRLGVSSKTGSLDLKAVDGSVSENPAVVDVALLDYDGREATLKLWINNQADPQGVRESLLASLRRRLGDEQEADVRIDFEEGSAA